MTADRTASSRRLVALGLLALVWAVFGQVRNHAFIDYDDGEYVYENAHVKDGLAAEGVVWAFTTTYAANWHPLTWLSHMADVELFGLDAGWHHLVNVLLHGLNAVLLFLVLRSMTGAPWRSAFVAALFAIHPLHVESVAWVAERKDVLSASFWFLTMGAYVRYARRPGPGRYALVLAALALGLLAKPMLVTLPFVLLLLDVWPLRRVVPGAPARIVIEKIPLLALAAASSVVTVVAQSSKSATASLEDIPLGARLAHAAVAYVDYLVKAVWPSRLSVFYPHPASVGEGTPTLQWVGAIVFLSLVTALAAWQWRRLPYLLVGWLWYLGTLVPVIGVVQVGEQAMADRYTYLPLIGILLIAAWGVPDLVEGWRHARKALVASGVGAVAVLSWLAFVQAGYWRGPPSLYEHAIAVTRRNFVAWNNLGMYHLNRGELENAADMFREAIRAKPAYAIAHYNLGVALAGSGLSPAAMAAYRETVRLDPAYVEAWVNLGILYRSIGDFAAAISCHTTALAIRPDDAIAMQDLVLAYAQAGDGAAAGETLRRLRAVDPSRAAQLARQFVSPDP